jgi:uncharacterized protein (DUF2141 family)
MRYIPTFFSFHRLAIVLTYASILILASCANEGAPSGGKKDVAPPKIKYASPDNKTLNFKANKIKIRFNEFIVQTLNPQEIVVSPPMDKAPKMIVEGKSLYISLKGKLKENTTYTINFGDAVKDINENNVYKNLTYVFATGPVLDTAGLSGTVSNIADKDLDNIIIGLYPTDSTDGILRSKPYYFAKTDKSGSFAINNIHPGKYWVYALRDQNLNYIYDQPNELIGFQDSVIELTDSSKLKFNLTVFESKNHKPKLVDAVAMAPGKVLISYNAPIFNLKLNTDMYAPTDFVELYPSKDTLIYWYSNTYIKKAVFALVANDSLTDSTRVDLKYMSKDSTNNRQKYALYIENQQIKADSNSKTPVSQNLQSPFKPLILNLSRPVDSINENKSLVIVNDSTKKRDNISFALDPKTKRTLSIATPQLEGMPHTLIIPDSTFRDIWGWWNRSMTYKWTADTKDNYGNIILSLKFENPEKYYIFRILDADNKAIETFYYVGNKEKKLTLKNVKAGVYHLQVVEDTNKNGEWDSGDFIFKTQPEQINNYKETYELKGNWDLEIEVRL